MEQLKNWMNFAEECDRGNYMSDMIEKSIPHRSFWEEGWIPAGRSGPVRSEGKAVSANVPLCDMFECDTEYLILMEVPGAVKSELDLTVAGTRLTVRGSKRYLETGWTALQTECARGPFERILELPQAAEGCHVSAKLENGVLWIRYPKQYRPQEKITVL